MYIVQIISGSVLGSGPALRADTPAGTSGEQPEPTIASELDTFTVAVNKQLHVINIHSQPKRSKSLTNMLVHVVHMLSLTHEIWGMQYGICSAQACMCRLQGDPRDAIISFAREEGLDLLLVGRSVGGRFKKVQQCCPTQVWVHIMVTA